MLLIFVAGLALGVAIGASSALLWVMHEAPPPLVKAEEQYGSWAELRERYHDDQFPPP